MPIDIRKYIQSLDDEKLDQLLKDLTLNCQANPNDARLQRPLAIAATEKASRDSYDAIWLEEDQEVE